MLLTFRLPVAIMATITHLWTVYIAFTEGGFWGGVLSFFMPFLSELFWMFQMFGYNDYYAYFTLATMILIIPFALYDME